MDRARDHQQYGNTYYRHDKWAGVNISLYDLHTQNYEYDKKIR